jgi:hypothetical protein
MRWLILAGISVGGVIAWRVLDHWERGWEDWEVWEVWDEEDR